MENLNSFDIKSTSM